jgi:hypothetical protein
MREKRKIGLSIDLENEKKKRYKANPDHWGDISHVLVPHPTAPPAKSFE